MKTFIIARGAFGAVTPFEERVTLERHRAPRVSALTVSIMDGKRVLAERSATFYGMTCPLRIADVEVFHRRDTDYCVQLMTPDPMGVVELASALAR